MELVSGSLRVAIERHGLGIVIAVIDDMAKAYAVHLEASPNGMFVKCHRDKKPGSIKTPPACRSRHSRKVSLSNSTCSPASSDSALDRSEDDAFRQERAKILEHRLPKGNPPPALRQLHVEARIAHKPVASVGKFQEGSIPRTLKSPFDSNIVGENCAALIEQPRPLYYDLATPRSCRIKAAVNIQRLYRGWLGRKAAKFRPLLVMLRTVNQEILNGISSMRIASGMMQAGDDAT